MNEKDFKSHLEHKMILEKNIVADILKIHKLSEAFLMKCVE